MVRGLKVIADSLYVESYEDALAPDTLTEYRVYAVDAMGWRSSTYASDSGYLGIPNGIIPRAPIKFEASVKSGFDVLHIENLAKSYVDKKLFSGLSFDLKRGEKIALIGENGRGKTTLFNIIMDKIKSDSSLLDVFQKRKE